MSDGRRDLLFRYADFRRLWLSQSVSMIGNRLATVALAIFATNLTHSPASVGLVLAGQTVPLLALLVFGGIVGDRFSRQRVMMTTDLLQTFLYGLLAFLIWTDAIALWSLVLLSVSFGASEAIFRPASTGLLPQTVPRERLQQAVAATQGSGNAAWFVGPALAGLLISGPGPAWPFAINAASFAWSAVLLARIGVRPPAEDAEKKTIAADLRDGFEQVRSRRWLWTQLAAHSMVMFAGLAAYDTIGPTLAREHFGTSSRFGLVTASLGLGLVLGSLIALRWRPGRLLLANLLALLGWPLLTGSLSGGAPFAIVLAISFCTGSATALSNAWWATVIAEQVPPEALARVGAYDWLCSYAFQPLGLIVFGAAASVAGPAPAMFAGALIVLTALLYGIASRIRAAVSLEPEVAP